MKWKEYSELKNTWESEKNLNECEHIMRNYCQQTDSSFRKKIRQSAVSSQKTKEQQKFWLRWQSQCAPHPSLTSQCSLSLDHQVNKAASEAVISVSKVK